jgi:hypothetical protein
MRWLAAACSAGALASAPALAVAAELAARGPAECPDADELSFRIERHIGVELGAAAPLRFDVTFERADAGYAAQIDVSAEPGAAPQRRTLTAPDCTKLGDAVSVAAALALGIAAPMQSEQLASELANAPAPAPVPAAPPAPAPGADQAGAAEPSAEPSTIWVPRVSLWVIGDAGSLPSPGLGAALGAELASGRFALRLLGTILFEQQTELASVRATAPGAKLELLTAGLLGCTLPVGNPTEQLSVSACAGLELGRLAGIGTGVPAPRRGSALWATPLVQVAGFWVVPGTTLRLGVLLTGGAPLNRDEFALTGIGTVYRPPNLVGRISLGLDVAFD